MSSRTFKKREQIKCQLISLFTEQVLCMYEIILIALKSTAENISSNLNINSILQNPKAKVFKKGELFFIADVKDKFKINVT